MTGSPSLLWFRLDLRLDDNPALQAAIAAGGPVIPVFIWAPEEEEPWPPRAASRWWLERSLRALGERLEARGSQLIVRRGPTLAVLERLIVETGAAAVYWNRRVEPAIAARDAAIEKKLPARTFDDCTLFHMERPYQVFTAFWNACLKGPQPAVPADAPRRIPAPERWPASHDLKLESRPVNGGWTPGEKGARAALKKFPGTEYEHERDRPDHAGTSRLSPHLHFGEISPRRVWHALAGADAYLRQLGWRDFAYHLLRHFPRTSNEPLRPEFAEFPWREDRALLKAWQNGETGYPMVDAGMRELRETGWMHNRARMVTASFLTKHLRIHWEEGAYWFWENLVDADLANNTLGWQWAAGCGADAAPYFRIFNPSRQAERFDPEGEYVRRWAPETRAPIVEHEQARKEALAAFATLPKR